jgi:hephaestin
MIISARGTTRANGTPRDVDHEFVVSFYEMDENESWYLEDNIRTYTSDPDGITIGRGAFGDINPYVNGVAVHGPNFKVSLNGFIYGHLPMLTMKVGERVRWYLMASTNFEVHAPHWHGNTVVAQVPSLPRE